MSGCYIETSFSGIRVKFLFIRIVHIGMQLVRMIFFRTNACTICSGTTIDVAPTTFVPFHLVIGPISQESLKCVCVRVLLNIILLIWSTINNDAQFKKKFEPMHSPLALFQSVLKWVWTRDEFKVCSWASFFQFKYTFSILFSCSNCFTAYQTLVGIVVRNYDAAI